MRHRKAGKILDRTADSRRHLRRQLAINLITHGKIKTTDAKAAFLQPFIERLITISRDPSLAHRRQLIKHLSDTQAVEILLTKIGPKMKERPGGYTRIIALGQRKGDGAHLANISIIE